MLAALAKARLLGVSVLAVLASCAALLIAPSFARAVTTVQYGAGYSGPTGQWRSVGVANRIGQYNYHHAGYQMCTYYTDSSDPNGTNPVGYYCATQNPASMPGGIGYGYAWMWNVNDQTGVLFTLFSVNA